MAIAHRILGLRKIVLLGIATTFSTAVSAPLAAPLILQVLADHFIPSALLMDRTPPALEKLMNWTNLGRAGPPLLFISPFFIELKGTFLF